MQIQGTKTILTFNAKEKVYTVTVSDTARVYYSSGIFGRKRFREPEIVKTYFRFSLTEMKPLSTIQADNGEIIFWKDIDQNSISIRKENCMCIAEEYPESDAGL